MMSDKAWIWILKNFGKGPPREHRFDLKVDDAAMADMVDETETVDKVSTWGGIPAKNSKGENLLLFIGKENLLLFIGKENLLFIGKENLLLFVGKEQQGGEPPPLHR